MVYPLSFQKSGTMEDGSFTARPRPMSFRNFQRQRSAMSSPTKMYQNTRFSVDVSASKPHRILSAPDQFLKLLEYSRDEVIGRSINLLQGPRSDAGRLESGICEVWKLDLSCFTFTLYSRTGFEHIVDVQCLPLVDADGKITGSTLQIQALGDAGTAPEKGRGIHPSCPASELAFSNSPIESF